jgi:serine/threonine protein kinase
VSGRLIAGRYRLGSVIGHGGMGVVWRARDELLDRDVAVKELTWPGDFTEQERETACRRAVREAQTAAQLNHPNIIRIYDIVEEDDDPWIVMELLPFRSLRDITADDGLFAPARAARIGLGVLAGLRAAHAAGIVHRDVKPANILVGPDDRAVLTDFGIARAADSATLTNAGDLIGSPSYIAPEHARGQRSGLPGDLWGLGASLYAAVEGRPPFQRDHALATLTAVVADEPDPAAHAGPLWPVISALLSKDPDARPDAAEAERMLRDVAGGAGTRVLTQASEPPAPDPVPPGPLAPAGRPTPPRPPIPPRPPWSRGRAALVTGLVVLGIAAWAAAFLLPSSSSPGRPTASSPPAHTRSAAARPSTASSGGQAATGSSRPAASASPSPSATGAGSGSAGNGSTASSSSTGSAGYGAMPAGFYRFTNSTGFSIGVPDGWQIRHVGHYVYLNDPSNGNIFLLIDQSDQPKTDPLADWQQQAAARAGSFPGYHLIRLQSVSYPQAEKAADWEFTYDRDGVLVHILNRNILASARHAYALYWSVPEAQWSAYYHYFQTFAATFGPAT